MLPPDPADLAVPSTGDALAAPRYGGHSLADVVPAAVTHLVGDEPAPSPLTGITGDRIVLLVIDGLGARQLARVPGLAPTLQSLPGKDVDAAFPSTTVTSLGSIGTGLPPSQHGLVGYAFALPDHDQPFNALVWRVGLRGGGFDARVDVVPEALQPHPTAFERAAAAGIATTVVVDPEFPDSGLTRATLRGGERRTARGLEATLDLAVGAVVDADGPALAYAHHPLVDWAGHTTGACSDEWCDAVAEVDTVLAGLERSLPPGVTVVVTADHGMLSIDDADVLELADRPHLLKGVRVLAGEPRVRHVALAEGVDAAEVAARWREDLGDRALVLRREQAMRLFGPDPRPAAAEHVGDLVVLARRGTLVHARVDPHGGRLAGHHGGPSRAERLVPCRRLVAT